MTKQAFLCVLTAMWGLWILPGCKSDTAKDAKVEPVLVLEPGQEPREQLRYTIQDGTITTSTMELSTSAMATTTSAGEKIAIAPSIRVVVSSGPSIKMKSGNTRFDLRIVKAEAIMPPGVDPETERDLNRSVALLKKVRGWVEVDDRGIVQASNLSQAAKDSNVPVRLLLTVVNARTSLARVILPAEPVGLGARWEARKKLKVYGFNMEQVDQYTLVEKVGDELKLGIDIVQTAPEQTVTFKREGVEFALKSLSMSAQGDVILNLNALEGSAKTQGQSGEVLTLKTVEGTEEIEINTAFQFRTTVRYDVSKAKAEAVEESVKKTGTSPK